MISPDTNIADLNIKDKIELIIESNGLLIDLLENCTIDGNIDLSNLKYLNYLPKDLKINGNLYCDNCINLKNIPQDLKVKSLSLIDCINLKKLPDGLKINGNLYLKDSGITNTDNVIIDGLLVLSSGRR